MKGVLDSLTFEEFRMVNKLRTTIDFHHALDSWSVAEWGNATAGECGEACNVAKKMICFRTGVDDLNRGLTLDDLRTKLTLEIGDMVIYADLWATSQGLRLEDCIRIAFNSKSEEKGLKVRV